MTTRKFGMFGLVLVAGLLAACDGETTVVPQPQPDVNLTIVPDTATILVGATRQLVAVVTGTTNQAATWTSSNNQIATVSGTGLVTAVTVGNAVITAVSQADSTARDAATVSVIAAPVVPPPSIVISSITQGSTTNPVNTQNVFGQIDITAELTVPPGAQVSRVEFLLDNNVLPNCTQTFTATGAGEITTEESQSAVPIICSVNTADFAAATGVVAFPNGPHTVSARVIQPNGSIAAVSSQQLVFNNQNFIVATPAFLQGGTTTAKACVNAGTNARSISGPGSLWCGGDLRVAVLGVNYGPASSALASATVAVTTSGVGVSGVAACRTTNSLATDPTVANVDGGAAPAVPTGNFPNCAPVTITGSDNTASDGLAVTFLSANNPDAGTPGVNNVEDVITITVNSVTAGGQAGPVCINPAEGQNPIIVPATAPPGSACGTGGGPNQTGSAPNAAFFVNPVRLDNLAPRVTLFDLTPNPPCQTTSCFVNGSFAFTSRAGFYSSVDYGVDSQNAATFFEAGASATALTRVATGAALNETVTSNDLFLRASARDTLGNVRMVYPTTTETVVTTSSTAGTLLKFGVDKTPPIITNTTAPANNGANDGTTFVIAFADTAPPGAGPAGFGTNPVVVKVERITPTGTTCLNPATGAAFANPSCGAAAGSNGNGFEATPGAWNVGNTTTNGYYRTTYFVMDGAGNVTPNAVNLTLIDTQAPSAGAIVGPSVITGNAAAAFSAAVTDNNDLGDARAVTNYGGLVHLQDTPPSAIGAYGPDAFTTSATATVTLPNFIRSIENGLGGGITQASAMTFLIRDQAGVVDNDACPTMAAPNTASANCFNRQDNISAAVTAGITAANPQTAFTATGMTAFTNAANNLTVCNGDDAGGTQSPACPTNPTSTTITASASGPSATFGNPFVRVNFYQNFGGAFGTTASILIGTATSASVTDVAGVRTFTWSVTWTPTAFAPGAYGVFALGVDAKGQSVVGTVNTITVAID